MAYIHLSDHQMLRAAASHTQATCVRACLKAGKSRKDAKSETEADAATSLQAAQQALCQTMVVAPHQLHTNGRTRTRAATRATF